MVRRLVRHVAVKRTARGRRSRGVYEVYKGFYEVYEDFYKVCEGFYEVYEGIYEVYDGFYEVYEDGLRGVRGFCMKFTRVFYEVYEEFLRVLRTVGQIYGDVGGLTG
eukprot:1187082-Prorocentrum_minimum.AAC.2